MKIKYSQSINPFSYYRLIIFLLVFSFLISSCGNSPNQSLTDKELELQKKELDLKQRELDLKEKQLAIDSIQRAQRENTSVKARFTIKNGALVLTVNVTEFIVAKDFDAPELEEGKSDGALAYAYISGASGPGTTWAAILEKNGDIKVIETSIGVRGAMRDTESNEILRIKNGKY